jgi:2-methylcitrate dehydratase PrpD
MDGAIELVNKHNLNPQNLESIRVGVNQQAYNLTGHSLETKKGSWGISAAKFSLPYCISVAIWKRKVFIEDFTKKAINDLNVIGTAKKVEVYVDPEIEAKVSTGVSLANVEFYTRDGSHYRAQSGALNGGSKVSLSFEGVAKKFVACNNAASRPLSTRKLSEIIDIVMDLEKLADIQELTRKFG